MIATLLLFAFSIRFAPALSYSTSTDSCREVYDKFSDKLFDLIDNSSFENAVFPFHDLRNIYQLALKKRRLVEKFVASCMDDDFCANLDFYREESKLAREFFDIYSSHLSQVQLFADDLHANATGEGYKLKLHFARITNTLEAIQTRIDSALTKKHCVNDWGKRGEHFKTTTEETVRMNSSSSMDKLQKRSIVYSSFVHDAIVEEGDTSTTTLGEHSATTPSSSSFSQNDDDTTTGWRAAELNDQGMGQA